MIRMIEWGDCVERRLQAGGLADGTATCGRLPECFIFPGYAGYLAAEHLASVLASFEESARDCAPF